MCGVSRECPTEDRSVIANGKNELLVRAYLDVGYGATVAGASMRDLALVVFPDLENLIFTCAHDCATVWGDIEAIDGSGGRRFKLSDQTAIKYLPRCNLLIGAARDDLRLVWAVGNLGLWSIIITWQIH